MTDWKAEQLIFVDERGINATDAERDHGWGKKGQQIHVSRPAGWQDNFSALPALTMDGYIACKVFKGAVNRDSFNDFIINDVLPQWNPFPGPKSIIVMDNASIHKSEVTLSLHK